MVFGFLFKKKPKKVKTKRIKKTHPPRRRTSRGKTKPARKKIVKKLTKKKSQAKKEELVGRVTHYFPRVRAGVIKITKSSLGLGDAIHIKGNTSDFTQKVASLQIDNKPIKKALKGTEVGLRVSMRVRKRDKVYKIK